MTHKNADLCNALAETQCSRTVLEREIILIKRSHLGGKVRHALFMFTSFEVKELFVQNEKFQELLDQKQLEIVGLFVWIVVILDIYLCPGSFEFLNTMSREKTEDL